MPLSYLGLHSAHFAFAEAVIVQRSQTPKETNSEFEVFRLKFVVMRAWGAKLHNGTLSIHGD
jgi:hypothetical protein